MRQRDDDTTSTEMQGGVVAWKRASARPHLPEIPVQKLPVHETLPLVAPEPATADAHREVSLPAGIPVEAQWTARHLTRMVGAGLLVLALGGTGLLGERYYRTGTSEDLTALVIGLVVVVVLWGVLIVSTPQLVSLRGSVLAVYASSDPETFDLADPDLRVDVVGVPEESDWAVVLRRQDDSATLVLRRGDVDASEFDPIVRHYRAAAEGRES